MALYRVLRHRFLLSLFLCRHYLHSALAYDFAKHEHYNHRRLCEHGLSSAHQDEPQLPKNIPFHLLLI